MRRQILTHFPRARPRPRENFWTFSPNWSRYSHYAHYAHYSGICGNNDTAAIIAISATNVSGDTRGAAGATGAACAGRDELTPIDTAMDRRRGARSSPRLRTAERTVRTIFSRRECIGMMHLAACRCCSTLGGAVVFRGAWRSLNLPRRLLVCSIAAWPRTCIRDRGGDKSQV